MREGQGALRGDGNASCEARCKAGARRAPESRARDRKSTRLNSSHANISYAVFCLKKKTKHNTTTTAHDKADLHIPEQKKPNKAVDQVQQNNAKEHSKEIQLSAHKRI